MRVLSVPASFACYVALAAYAAAALAFVFVSWMRRDAASPDGVVTRALGLARGAFYVAVLAHAIDIAWRGVLHVHPAQTSREALGFAVWLAAVGFAWWSRRHRWAVPGIAISLTALALLTIARFSPPGASVEGLSFLGRMHVSLATVAVALYGLAGTAAALYLREAALLKQKRVGELTASSGGASVLSLERLASQLLLAGGGVLLPALLLGVMWQRELEVSWLRLETVLAWAAWLITAGSVALEAAGRLRPSRKAQATVVSSLLALAILVAYVVQRVHA